MANTYVYVSNAEDGDISTYRLDPARAELQPLARTPAAQLVMPLCFDPVTNTLHAAVRRAPFAILSYRVDPSTGALTPLAQTSVSNSFVNLRIDASARWLLAASYGANLVSTYALDAEGLPQQQPACTVDIGPMPHATVVDHDNAHVLVPALGDDRVHALRFDADSGQLSAEPAYTLATAPGSGPRHAVLSADGRFLYVLNELLGTVLVFERVVEASGAEALRFVERQCVPSIPADTGMVPGRARPPSGVTLAAHDMHAPDSIYCADIQMRPDGRFLYTSERTRGLLSRFSVDAANGRIEHLDTIATLASPRSFAIDPTGRFMVVAGQNTPRVALYGIDHESGALRLLHDAPGGRDANWVTIAHFE